jgi:hypothetical protein
VEKVEKVEKIEKVQKEKPMSTNTTKKSTLIVEKDKDKEKGKLNK